MRTRIEIERCMNGKKNSIKMGDRSMLKQRFVTTSMMYNHHNHHDNGGDGMYTNKGGGVCKDGMCGVLYYDSSSI